MASSGKGPSWREPRSELADLYVRHVPAANRLAFLLTGDRTHAEDLVHDAFVRCVGRFGHLRAHEAFDAYLRRTIVNLHTSGLYGGMLLTSAEPTAVIIWGAVKQEVHAIGFDSDEYADELVAGDRVHPGFPACRSCSTSRRSTPSRICAAFDRRCSTRNARSAGRPTDGMFHLSRRGRVAWAPKPFRS